MSTTTKHVVRDILRGWGEDVGVPGSAFWLAMEQADDDARRRATAAAMMRQAKPETPVDAFTGQPRRACCVDGCGGEPEFTDTTPAGKIYFCTPHWCARPERGR